jgi:dephospho-CoA kinase
LKIVGLTGGIGTGKSTVAKMFVKRGAKLIDADLVAREVVNPEKPAYLDILKEFGEKVLLPDKTINREALGDIVFNDEEKRNKLNTFTHPRIGEEMVGLIQKYTKEGAEITIIDAALLFESKATSWIKPVIVVIADMDIKTERICNRDALCVEDVQKRMDSQWSDEKRAKLADYVIDNSTDLESLEEQAEEIWQKLKSL